VVDHAGRALADLLRRAHSSQHPRPGGGPGAGAPAVREGDSRRRGGGGKRSLGFDTGAAPSGGSRRRGLREPAITGARDGEVHERNRELPVGPGRPAVALCGTGSPRPEREQRSGPSHRALQGARWRLGRGRGRVPIERRGSASAPGVTSWQWARVAV
jgi:hypothetical protein